MLYKANWNQESEQTNWTVLNVLWIAYLEGRRCEDDGVFFLPKVEPIHILRKNISCDKSGSLLSSS